MSKNPNRTQWMLFLGLAIGLATTALTQAAQPKNKDQLDQEAEAKQSAKEDAEQGAAGEKAVGAKYQHIFFGKFAIFSDDSQKPSPDVVGSFTTNSSDKKPGRNYLVKVENGNKVVLATLKRSVGKSVQLIGNLRVFGQDGEAKYLIVTSVTDASPTPPVADHRKYGGL